MHNHLNPYWKIALCIKWAFFSLIYSVKVSVLCVSYLSTECVTGSSQPDANGDASHIHELEMKWEPLLHVTINLLTTYREGKCCPVLLSTSPCDGRW